MNSMLFVNQSASCLLMSRGKARQLGVAEDRMVYLHGCGDANDPRPVIRGVADLADMGCALMAVTTMAYAPEDFEDCVVGEVRV